MSSLQEEPGGVNGIEVAKSSQNCGCMLQELWTHSIDLGQNLGPRTDAIEAKLQAVQDTVEEMNTRFASLQRELLVFVEKIDGVELRMNASAEATDDLRLRFQVIPTRDQVISLCRIESGQIEDFRQRLDAIEKQVCLPEETHLNIREELARSMQTQQVAAKQLEELRSRLDEVAQMDCVREVARTVAMHEAAVSELRLHIPRKDHVQDAMPSLEIEDLQHKIMDVSKSTAVQSKQIEAYDTALSDLREQMKATCRVHESRLAELHRLVSDLPSHEQVLVTCRDTCSSQVGILEDLKSQLKALENSHENVHHARCAIGSLPELEVPGEEHSQLTRSLREHADAIADIRHQLHLTLNEDSSPRRQAQSGSLESLASLQAQVSELHLRMAVMPTPEYLETMHQQISREREFGTVPQLEAFDALNARMENLQGRFADIMDSRSEALDKISELRLQIADLPTREHILDVVREGTKCIAPPSLQADKVDAVCAQVQSVAGDISDNTSQVALLNSQLSDLQNKNTAAAAGVEDAHLQAIATPSAELTLSSETRSAMHMPSGVAVLERLDGLQLRLDNLSQEVEAKRLDEMQVQQSDRLHELKVHYDTLSQDVQAVATSNAEVSSILHERLPELASACKESTRAVTTLQQKVEAMPSLEDLQTSMQLVAEVVGKVQAVGASSADAAAVLNEQLQEVLAKPQEAAELTNHADAPQLWETMFTTAQLENECSALRRASVAMQELVDDKILVSLHSLERQSSEASGKVELIMAEQTQQFAKVDEYDLRLNLAVAKLESCDQKVRDCMSRIEQLPTSSHVRALLQESSLKCRGDIDVDDLTKRLAQTLGAVEDIQQSQQKHAVVLRRVLKLLDEAEDCAPYDIAKLKQLLSE